MRIYIKPVTNFKGMEMESQLLSSSSSAGDAADSKSYNEYPIKFGGPTGSAD